MKDFIEILTIFLRYNPEDTPYPFNCDHDVLRIYPNVLPHQVSAEDLARLEKLGVEPDEEFADEGGWASYRFGSC